MGDGKKIDDKIILVYSTFPDEKTARETCRQLVEQKLAACANLFPAMRSIYHWDGEIQCDSETAVLLKTRQSRMEELGRTFRLLHPYDIPAFIGVEAFFVEAGYEEWLRTRTNNK